MFYVFYHTASATAYGRRPKFVRAEGENCAYGPTLLFILCIKFKNSLDEMPFCSIMKVPYTVGRKKGTF
jgi:hypothetical protein